MQVVRSDPARYSSRPIVPNTAFQSSPRGVSPWGRDTTIQFPAGDHDWDRLMPVIKDLYLVKNLPLRRVAHVMKTEHGFKASERMYKTRFVKWGWKKTGKARAVQSTRANRLLTKGLDRNSAHVEPGAQNTFYSRGTRMLMHESPGALTVDAAIRAYRAYIVSWAETDSRWRKPTKYQDIDVTSKEFTLQNDLRLAVNYMNDAEYVEGGRFLRLAFLAVETVIQDDHLHSCYDLFVWCPLKIIGLAQPIADNIMQAYTRYLYQQALVHRRNHPMTVMAHSLYAAASTRGVDGALAFVFSMVRLCYDMYVRLRGGVNVSAVAKLSLYADAVRNATLQHQVMTDLMELARAAAYDLGEDDINTLLFRSAALTHRGGLRLFDETFLASAEYMVPIVTRRYVRYEKTETDHWYDKHNDFWLYRNAHFQLVKYWAHHGDLDKVVQYARAATSLDYEPDEHWKAFSRASENYLRQSGLNEEAGAIAERRRLLDMSTEVRHTLEKEEIIDPTIAPESRAALGEEDSSDDE